MFCRTLQKIGMEGKQKESFLVQFCFLPAFTFCLSFSMLESIYFSAKGNFSSALSFLDRNNDQESKLRQNEWNEIKRGRKRESGFNEEPNDGFEEGKDLSVLLVRKKEWNSNQSKSCTSINNRIKRRVKRGTIERRKGYKKGWVGRKEMRKKVDLELTRKTTRSCFFILVLILSDFFMTQFSFILFLFPLSFSSNILQTEKPKETRRERTKC